MFDGCKKHHHYCLQHLHTVVIDNELSTWLSTYEQLPLLARKCGWLGDLILFELNHSNKPWHNEEPRFYGLNEQLISYLKEGYKKERQYQALDPKRAKHTENYYENYYNRIASFETRRRFKKVR